MSKLRLDLDNLSVDSFETASPDGARRGTVAAHRAADSGVSCIAYSCGVGYCEPGTSLQPAPEPSPGDTLIC